MQLESCTHKNKNKMKINFFNLGDIHLKKRKKDTSLEWYKQDYIKFVEMSKDVSDFKILDNFSCVHDKNDDSGVISGAYFHQDLYVAKQIYNNNPIRHVDVGSRIDGFVAHVAIFRNIEIIDIRKLNSKVENIVFKQIDLTSELLPDQKDYCDSISSLHALEHFGLGRYGDSIDPLGHLKGFSNISMILKPGGLFYFSVPMGEQRIEFNAHRIFSLEYLIEWVEKDFEINLFSYVDDKGDFFENVDLTNDTILNNFNCNHGCAIFVLKKKFL